MADGTSGYLSAGIQVSIGGASAKCCATPDMGADPEKVDVTSFDDLVKKRYIAGLEDVQTLNFDFIYTGTLPADVNNASCSVTYPGSASHSFTADVRFFMLAAAPGDPLKYRASCVVTDWGGSSSSSGGGT